MLRWSLVLMTLLAAISAQAEDEPSLSIRQKILMPGLLAESHAKYETECETCHTSFTKQDLSRKCLACHKDIANDRKNNMGFHGKYKLAATTGCETCHTDHEGREFDIVGLQVENFPHQHTQFPLLGQHALLTCNQCHKSGKSYRDASLACISCHGDADIHRGALGEQCEQCHLTMQWLKRKTFDHNKTHFKLHGKHEELECGTCHFGQRYKFSDTRCVACHWLGDVHAGDNGEDCVSCHKASGWHEVQFDHADTGFALNGRHADTSCEACHGVPGNRKTIARTCVGCHESDDVHLGRNGRQCGNCHSEREWRTVKFDHTRDANFPLLGKHAVLRCSQCHKNGIEKKLPRDCASCHLGDDVHHNDDMRLCGTCHNPQAWQSINYFDHDHSHFPLIGMHQIVLCDNCHIGNQFSGTASTCNDCHQTQDIHLGALGRDCGMCHTPNAWQSWVFDHNNATQYELQGKHRDISCGACHKPGTDPKNTPHLCGNCHRQQDVHNGEFGDHCERCHLPESFLELLFQ